MVKPSPAVVWPQANVCALMLLPSIISIRSGTGLEVTMHGDAPYDIGVVDLQTTTSVAEDNMATFLVLGLEGALPVPRIN